MRLRLSKASQWVIGSLVLAAAIGIGSANVSAQTSTLKSWRAGETLSADDLNANFQALRAAVDQAIPPGVVIAYAGPIDHNPNEPGLTASAHTPPAGWLWCNGAAVSRADYKSLYAAVGIAHGGGDGVATFNLPDYRGLFLRGVDSGVGRDPNAAERTAPQAGVKAVLGGPGNAGDAVGSVQESAFAKHTHDLSNGRESADGCNFGAFLFTATIYAKEGGTCGGKGTEPAGGAETRPLNTSVNYLIKY